MKIPLWYYISFWIETSVLATATGAIVGYIVLGIFFGPYGLPIGAILGFTSGQISTINHFTYKKRGRFEFLYQKRLANLKTDKALAKKIGWSKTLRTYFTEVGEINWSSGGLYDKLLSRPDTNLYDKGMIYLRAGILAQKRRNYEKCIKYLSEANDNGFQHIMNDFISAQAFERIGDSEHSIEKYEQAVVKAQKLSVKLSSYINSQIERVKVKGPAKKPTMPGLRHSGMGR